MSDKTVKEKLRSILVEVFELPIEKVDCTNRTTDLIVKVTDDPQDWFYFEIKSTDKKKRKNQNAYFGAASLNQLKMAYAHPKHYFFVLANKVKEDYNFALISIDDLLSFLTGYYLYADFSIPDDIMTTNCFSPAIFKGVLTSLRAGMQFKMFPNNQNSKMSKITSLKEIVKSNTNNHGTN